MLLLVKIQNVMKSNHFADAKVIGDIDKKMYKEYAENREMNGCQDSSKLRICFERVPDRFR